MKNVYYNNHIPFTLEDHQIFDIEMGRDVFNWRISKKREQYVSIDAVHIHPQFNENTFDSDIALKTKQLGGLCCLGLSVGVIQNVA